MAKTDYLENAVVNHVLRNTSLTSPTSVFVGLTSTATTDAGGGTELSGNGYARQQVTFGAPTQVGGAAEVANSGEVLFPQATAAWTQATHFFIADAATAGNRLYHGPLATPRTAGLGDQIRFQAGTLKVSEA
jgi:hypothetical protein